MKINYIDKFNFLKFISITFIVVYIILISNVFLIFLYYKGYDKPFKEYVGYFLDSHLYLKNTLLSKIQFNKNQLSNLESLYLQVENNSIKKMLSNVPNSIYKKKYYDALLAYPDGINREIKFRIRGRNNWHWRPEKPSLRLKLRKKNTIGLYNHLNLINPEDKLMIANPFGEDLARKFGILANKTKFVNVYINNKFIGLYHMLGRLDESFLRNNKIMPGPIYTGDNLESEWNIKDFETINSNNYIKKFYYNDQNNKKISLNIFNPLEKLIHTINGPINQKTLSDFWNIIDKEKLASFSALMTVSANTHTDYVHNQAFIYNTSKGKLEPVAVDMNILGMLLKPGGKYRFLNSTTNKHDILSKQKKIPFFSLPFYEKITPILNFALSDPSFVNLRNKKIYESITSFASTKNQISMIDQMINNIKFSIINDKNKGYLENTFSGYLRFPYSNYEFKKEIYTVKEFIYYRNKYLMDELLNNKIFIGKMEETKSDIIFEINLYSHSSVMFEIVNNFNKNEFEIFVNNKFETLSSDILLLHPNLSKSFDDELHLNNFKKNLIGRRYPLHTLKVANSQFILKTSIKNYNELIKDKEKYFKNTLKEIKLNFVDNKPTHSEINIHTALKNFEFVEPQKLIILGPGEIQVKKDLIFKANETVKVSPGTFFNFKGNFSFIVNGKIYIEGTKDNPIKFFSDNNKWGSLAILGKKTSGSIIKNCIFKNGSFSNFNNIDLSGMISIYNSDDVSISNVKIENNFYGDDSIRSINSNVDLNNIDINNCYGDCIDLDYSSGKIKDINIALAGNDGLDFMNSKVELKNIFINQCGDKGISIGERSIINGNNINITNCDIGIASKDDSRGTFSKSIIENNQIGVAKYLKNWRYRFKGQLQLEDSIVINNKINEFDGKNKIYSELKISNL